MPIGAHRIQHLELGALWTATRAEQGTRCIAQTYVAVPVQPKCYFVVGKTWATAGEQIHENILTVLTAPLRLTRGRTERKATVMMARCWAFHNINGEMCVVPAQGIALQECELRLLERERIACGAPVILSFRV